ncbi:MAG TPA: rod shape-determining protein MreC [Candidatus Limnocylindrales bacterium]|nr:rod shape-determining protein MreC [Candidatus Limnocylindrales bacterium]
MTNLLASRTARRRSIVFTAFLASSLVMMAFSSNPLAADFQGALGFALRPVQGAIDDVAEGVAGVFQAVSDIDRLHSDNAALRRENERLTAENLRLEEAQRENELLTGLLQLQSSFAYETTAAEVIARESSEFRRVVTIGKGSNAGIAQGDVVIAEGGALVGRVVELGPDHANVILITDQSSTVIGQVQISGATGEVIGQLGGALIMRNIDSTEEIELGEEVVTAGIELAGGIRSPYPKGLLLGQVIDVRRDANSVVQTAYLAPTTNLDKIEYVLVVLDYEGGLPPADEQPIDCSEVGEDGALPGGEQPCIEPTPTPGPSAAPSAPNAASPLLP